MHMCQDMKVIIIIVGLHINQWWDAPIARNRAACYALDMDGGIALAPHTSPYARVKLARQIR